MSHDSLASVDDLWGAEFGEETLEATPLFLLVKQAEALTRRTEGRVVGKAVASVDVPQGTVWTSLYAEVPTLGGFRRKVLSVAYPITRDPVDPTPVRAYGLNAKTGEEIVSLDKLIAWLSRVLSSKEVHGMIQGLQYFGRDSVA